MNTSQDISEVRAGIYWWFSTLFIEEINEDRFAALRSDKGKTLLDAISNSGLTQQVQDLTLALQRAENHSNPLLELAADFAQSFLRDAHLSALPYASAHLSSKGLLFQESHQRMTDLLERNGIALDASLNEPCDHIAVQLDYLGNLALQGANGETEDESTANLQSQLQFIDEHLLNWIPQFSEKAGTVRDAEFYPALIRLFKDYLKLDRAFIADSLPLSSKTGEEHLPN